MTDLLHPWLILAGLLAALHWLARWKGWNRLALVTKPTVMAALILWSFSFGGWTGTLRWFGAGLVLSLCGDVALMLPPRFFPLGLSFFLLAHAAYIGGFCLPIPALHLMLLFVAALLALGGWFYFHTLARALRARAYGRRFIVPVVLYGIVLSIMTLSACQTLLRPDWLPAASALATAGGLLFLASDSLLAYNRFVSPLPGGKTLEMVAYHLAQAAIIGGALLQSA